MKGKLRPDVAWRFAPISVVVRPADSAHATSRRSEMVPLLGLAGPGPCTEWPGWSEKTNVLDIAIQWQEEQACMSVQSEK